LASPFTPRPNSLENKELLIIPEKLEIPIAIINSWPLPSPPRPNNLENKELLIIPENLEFPAARIN
jgi:hypothetical protein